MEEVACCWKKTWREEEEDVAPFVVDVGVLNVISVEWERWL